MSKHAGYPVNCVRFSKDGNLLASAGDYGLILIWEENCESFAEEGSSWIIQKTIRIGSESDVYDIAWFDDNTKLCAATTANEAIVIDLTSLTFTKLTHEHIVQGVAVDPLGQYIATQSNDRYLILSFIIFFISSLDHLEYGIQGENRVKNPNLNE